MGQPPQHTHLGTWTGRGSVTFTRSLVTSKVAQGSSSIQPAMRGPEHGGVHGRFDQACNGPHHLLSDPLDSHMVTPSCKGGQAACARKEEMNMDSVNFSEPQFSLLRNTPLIAFQGQLVESLLGPTTGRGQHSLAPLSQHQTSHPHPGEKGDLIPLPFSHLPASWFLLFLNQLPRAKPTGCVPIVHLLLVTLQLGVHFSIKAAVCGSLLKSGPRLLAQGNSKRGRCWREALAPGQFPQ